MIKETDLKEAGKVWGPIYKDATLVTFEPFRGTKFDLFDMEHTQPIDMSKNIEMVVNNTGIHPFKIK